MIGYEKIVKSQALSTIVDMEDAQKKILVHLYRWDAHVKFLYILKYGDWLNIENTIYHTKTSVFFDAKICINIVQDNLELHNQVQLIQDATQLKDNFFFLPLTWIMVATHMKTISTFPYTRFFTMRQIVGTDFEGDCWRETIMEQ